MTTAPRTTTAITQGRTAAVRLTRMPTDTVNAADMARMTAIPGLARTGRPAATAISPATLTRAATAISPSTATRADTRTPTATRTRTATATGTATATRLAILNQAATALRPAMRGRAATGGQAVMAAMRATANRATRSRGLTNPVTATGEITARGQAA